MCEREKSHLQNVKENFAEKFENTAKGLTTDGATDLEDDVVGEHVFDASYGVLRLRLGQFDRHGGRLEEWTKVGQLRHRSKLLCNQTSVFKPLSRLLLKLDSGALQK